MTKIHAFAKKPLSWVLLFLAAALLIATFTIPTRTKTLNPQTQIQDAWVNMQKAGAYSFSTVVEQAIHPAPSLSNVGRSAERQIYFLDGSVDLASSQINMRLFQQSTTVLDPNNAIEIRVEDGESFGRSNNSEWVKLDGFSTDGFAPGNDFSSFLRAASNVQLAETEKRSIVDLDGKDTTLLVDHYTFAVDSIEFAAYMRDQMVIEYQRAGKLPLGMELGISDEYRNMVADGQVWVSQDGYPIHMEISMQMPQESNGEQVEATIKTDFSDIQRGQRIASLPLPLKIASELGWILPPSQWQATMLGTAGASLFCLALFWMLLNSQRKVMNVVLSMLLIALFIFTPLWQSHQSLVFAKDIDQKQAKMDQQTELDKAEKETINSLYNNDWDAHQAPSSTTGSLLPLLSDNSLTSWVPLSAPLKEDTTGDQSSDRDHDGLTDEFESAHDITMLDPDNPDTDGDGLLDGEEMKLGTSPGEADSDRDGITDFNEVNSFYYRNANNSTEYSGDWYSDPNNRDTDRDSILDGLECEARVIDDTNPSAGICRDQDGDGIPDIFDSDDDADGVPTIVDADPYGAVSELFSAANPLQVSIRNVQSGMPTFVEYQLRPENTQHLTYMLNVLDWPSGDDDGQIQRINNTTYGDNLASADLEADPRPSYGDLRLVPMAEITVKNSVPFELTETFITQLSSEGFAANLEFSAYQSGGNNTRVKLTGVAEGITYKLYYGNGTCESSSSVQLIASIMNNGSGNIAPHLGAVAEGTYAFYIKDSSDKLLACAMPLHAHATLQDEVMDTSLVEAYGGFARNDEHGQVLAYLPLSILNDISGSNPVAFSVKIPFSNIGNRLNQSDMEVRMVWLLNMLTDVCKPMPSTFTESETTPWCDKLKPERWYKDVARVVHSYNDEFKLTGAKVTEDHGVDMSVIFEDPQTDAEPQYDDPLWTLTYGLQGSLLAGRSDFNISDISTRFDREEGIYATGAEQLWGTTAGAFQVENYHYDFFDQFHVFNSDQVNTLFGTYFPTAVTDAGYNTTNLLFARQFDQRTQSITGQADACSGSHCIFDFSGVELLTTAMVNWSPYHFLDGKWQTYPLQSYLDLLEARMRLLDDFQPEDDSTAERNYVDGKIDFIRYYYQTYFQGTTGLIKLNGNPIANPPAEMPDIDLHSQFFSLQGKGKGAGSIISTVAKMVMDGIDRLALNLKTATNTERVKMLFTALGDSLQQKAKTISEFLKKTFIKVAVGILVVVVVVAMVTMAIIALAEPDSAAGQLCMKILTISMSVLTIALAVMALKDLIPLVKASQAISANAQKASIIGAIIAGVITWGIFIYVWASSGISFGSLAFNSALADAIAATMTIILMAALACTGVGAIIVAIVGIIDAIITAFCTAFGVNDREGDDWAKDYICIGISGWVTKIFKWVIYSNNYLVDYDNTDRLEFKGVSTDYQNESLGITYGNNMKVNVNVTNTIELSDVPFDWKAAAYAWQYTNNNAKTSTFSYLVQPGETDIHDNLDRGSMSSLWTSAGNDKWSYDFLASTNGYSIPLPVAGINRDPVANISEGSALPVQECWAIPIFFPFFFLIPVCYIRTEKATFQIPLDSSLTLDVFPATLDQFYSLSEVSNGGYSFSWGRDATLTFPIFKDADGDKLISRQQNGNDPDDSKFDTDFDGISDYDELRFGTNPQLFDSDDDGLYDIDELMVGTDPNRKDSDGDGLTDDLELKGWFFTYGFYEDGSPKETMVYPNPLLPDTDQDGITDLEERIYGFNPNVAESANILNYTLSSRELDAPVVMMSLDEFSGTTLFADQSNFKFDAFCADDACPLSGLPGVYRNSALFDGQDALYLPTTAKQINFLGNQQFTLAAWVFPQGDGSLIAKWQDGIENRQELDLQLNGMHPTLQGTDSAVTSSAVLPQGEWSHLAVSFDGSRIRFYVNGSLQNTCLEGSCAWQNTHVFDPGTLAAPLSIGATFDSNGSPQNGFTGYLDEVQVYDHTLSDVQLDEQAFIQTRLMTHRYNVQDDYIRPAERLEYTSVVENLLNSRFAYGLLNTIIAGGEAIINLTQKLLPRSFILYPDNPVVTGVNTTTNVEELQIRADFSQSQDLTFEQTASAQIVDRRTESNYAQLWLKFNESGSPSTFIDSSGNMPPRDATCSSCPLSGQVGMLNNAIQFIAGQDTPLALPTLDKLNLLNRGLTVSFWIKPNANGSGTLTLLKSGSNQLTFNLLPSGSDYVPQVYRNGSQLTLTSGTRKINGGQWNQVVLRYDDGSKLLEVFVNGEKSASATNVSVNSTDDTLRLGGSPQSASYVVDDLRIFNRPLGILDINRLAERPVLELKMETSSFSDSSAYNQSISIPIQAPKLSTISVRGNSLNPSSGSSTGYIKVNGNALLRTNDSSFTFSTWIYPQSISSSNWEGIFGNREFGSEATAYPTLERQGAYLRFGYGDGSSYVSTTSGALLSNNTWYHLVITYKQNISGQYEYRLYLNSELKASYLFNSPPATSGTSFYIGHSSTSYTTYLGTLYMDNEHDAGSHAEPYIYENRNGSYYHSVLGEQSMADGDTKGVNHSDTITNFAHVRYVVMEADDSSGDDYCGDVNLYWYTWPTSGTASLSNGFDGRLTYSFSRPSVQFYGIIDEFQVYRYAIDSEQVFDFYNSLPLTAGMPLDDRPATDSFVNKAVLGDLDDGVCSAPGCPAAGTIGLIDQAVRFDGENDLISIPVNTTQDYMVSLWVNTTCPNCGLYSLNLANGTSLNQIYLRGGNVCSKVQNTEMCSRNAVVINGQWHHVVYSNKDGASDLWLDGLIVNHVDGDRLQAAGGGTAVLGKANLAGQVFLNGQLDDVRIYRYSQADQVVAQLLQRAPYLLSHLDDKDAADGISSDTAADWSLNCAFNNDPALNACPQTGVKGRLGTALQFDGGNDSLRLQQDKLSSTLQSFSVSIWVKPTSVVNSAQTIWSLWNADNSEIKYSLGIIPDGMQICVLTANEAEECNADSNVELIMNVWNHISLSVNRDSASQESYQLYVNGYLDSSGIGDHGSKISNGLGKFDIGNKLGGSQAGGAYLGLIDEVSIYSYAVNEISIRDSFHYQMEHVEESDSITVKIDADNPTVDFASYDANFPYVSGVDRIIHVEGNDETSGISAVDMSIDHANLPAPVHTLAPVCLDSASGTSFCPTFDPTSGDGTYYLNFRAIDRVGNQTISEDYSVLVDSGKPRVTINIVDQQVLNAWADTEKENYWVIDLSGNIQDEPLSDNKPGSGIDLENIFVTIYNEFGAVVGEGRQKPQLNATTLGYSWALSYRFPEFEPTGALTLVVEAMDKVGNKEEKSVDFLLDATAPQAGVDESSLPLLDMNDLFNGAKPADESILKEEMMTGSASDIPGLDLMYMTENGENAVSGVGQVQMSLKPSLDVSYLFNEPYADGLLVWLPLDKEEVPNGSSGSPDEDAPMRYYLDSSPYQIAGECETEDCPMAGPIGHKNGSMYFNGDHKYINLGNQVNLANRSFSISVWVNRDQNDRNDPILWQGPLSLAKQRFLMGFNASNQFVCGFGGSDLVTPGSYESEIWQNWACSYDAISSQRTIWLDGQALVSDSVAPMISMEENLFVSLAPVGSFKGYLDEIVIYDQALTAAAVREQYTAYQSVYHLDFSDAFVIGGDWLDETSGYYNHTQLITSAGDSSNKSTAGAVGDYAIQLDGSAKLKVSPYTNLNLDRGQFTQSAWVNPGINTLGGGVISQQDENPEMRYPSLMLTADGGIRVGFGNGYNWFEITSPGGLVPSDRWSLLAATFDGTTYKLYVNGLEVLSDDSLAGKLPYPAQQFNIGENFKGMLDEVSIFARALSAEEIFAFYQMGWKVGELESNGNSVTWNATVPYGLEGSYNVNVRGWDGGGHYRANQKTITQWGGGVDSYPPRMSVTQTFIDPEDENVVRYDFEITDTMLDLGSIHQNLCTEVTFTTEYFNSSWYLAGGVPPNTAPYRITGNCTGTIPLYESAGLTACDAAGNCSAQWFDAKYPYQIFLPLVVGSGEGLGSGDFPNNARLDQILEAALDWPSIQNSQKREEVDLIPVPRLDHETLTSRDRRSIMTININGRLENSNSLKALTIKVWAGDQLLLETQAAVIGDIWNATWLFAPSNPPPDGFYSLEMIVVDQAGGSSTTRQSIEVSLSR